MRWDFRDKRIQRGTAVRPAGPRFQNPLFTKGSWSKALLEHPGFFALLLLAVVCGTFYLAWYSPVFTVTDISLVGFDSISQVEFRNHIMEYVNSPRLGIIPQNNLVALSTGSLRDHIKEKYTFAELSIHKNLPGTLEITAIENKPFALFASGNVEYIIEESGIISSIASESEEMDSLVKIVEEVSIDRLEVGNRLFGEDVAKFMMEFPERLHQDSGVSFDQWVIPSRDSQRLHAQTADGWQIYFQMQKDLDQQYENFLTLWRDRLSEDPPNEYVDMRILDRVFYK